jgi:hypothetical protein
VRDFNSREFEGIKNKRDRQANPHANKVGAFELCLIPNSAPKFYVIKERLRKKMLAKVLTACVSRNNN